MKAERQKSDLSPSCSGSGLLDSRIKGAPQEAGQPLLSSLEGVNWSLPNEDLSLPALTLSETAFAHNLAVMNQFAADQGVYLCPHGKTVMSPQLFADILRGNRTIGLSAATIAQARVIAECGAPVVLLANQVVGKSNIRGLASLREAFPKTRFLSLVDSISGLEQLIEYGAPLLPDGTRFELLIEIGYPQARTGVRTETDFRELVDAFDRHNAAGAPISLCGIEAYEGSITGSHAERQVRISDYLDFAMRCFEQLSTSNRLAVDCAPLFTAGGSSTFDLVVREYLSFDFRTRPPLWLRGGVAPFYDHGVYRTRLTEMDARDGFVLAGEKISAVECFRPALSLWAVVQSIPESGLAILAAGMRDFPHDAGLPIALAHYRSGVLVAQFTTGGNQLRIEKAMDQHAYMPISAGADIRVGDVFRFGISHPCTTFDKWRFVFCADDDHRVTRIVETIF